MKGMMKAVVKTKAGKGAELREVPIPEIGRDEMLVKVHAASICGSDLHIYHWDPWAASRMSPPVVIGHEFSGEVVEVGDEVESFKVGDRVSSETHFVCGHCEQCRTHHANICPNTVILGINVNGAFAEYVKIPQKAAWKNTMDIDPAYLSIQEPLGNAVHTILEGPTVGQTIAIVGCGPVGVLSIPVAKKAGAKKIYAIEPNNYRADLAKKLGADVVINPFEADPIEFIQKDTDGRGVDVVAEMSGNPIALRQAVKYVKPGGQISLLGLANSEITLDFANDVTFKGLIIKGIAGRKMFDTWYTVRSLLESPDFNIKPAVTHRFKLEDFEEGIHLMESGNSGKIALYPDQDIFEKYK